MGCPKECMSLGRGKGPVGHMLERGEREKRARKVGRTLKHPENSFPSPGLCSRSALPDPYQSAFRLGSAHLLPGLFLPDHIDWFCQCFLVPFMVMYAAPALSLVPMVILMAIREPASYGRFWQTLTQQRWTETALLISLLGLCALLIGVCAYQAWDMALPFYRTWHVSRMRQRGEQGYGVVLLSHALVGRFVDNVGRHNCLWLPRSAITAITWQQVREDGAKRSHWIYRSHIRYQDTTGGYRSLKLTSHMLQCGYSVGDPRGDRALYDTLSAWWHQSPL